MSGKTSYRSTRNRRKPQPGGDGAPARPMYQLQGGDIDVEALTLTVNCVIWSVEEEELIPVVVWLDEDDYTGAGLTVEDDQGLMIPTSVRNIEQEFIEVVLPRAIGLVTMTFQPRVRSMTTLAGVQCAGGIISTRFARDCIPDTETFYGEVSDDFGNYNLTFEGSLNLKEFNGVGDYPLGAPEYRLIWDGGSDHWVMEQLDETPDDTTNEQSTRCNPLGTYQSADPYWNVNVSINPP